jgi:two-component system NtrC family sensor kinase
VSDTGKGIPAAELNRIFDPFFTTKPVGKGTGLGLSICYGIIEKLNGKLECKSTVGVGTSFYVSIPLPQESNLIAGEE